MVIGMEREIKADAPDVVADIPKMPTLALRVMDMGGEIKADVSVDGHIKATMVDIPNMSTPTGEIINVGGEIKADVAVDGHIEAPVADIPKMPTPAGEVVMDEESKGDIPMDGETKARMVMDGESQDIVASAPTPVVVNKMRTLEKYSIDLTKLAEEGKLDPLIGRQTQIERVTQILCRRTKSNPCLIGDPGVGKTAIVEGLAQLIVKGDVPRALQGKKVRTLDMGQLVACTRHRGEFEDKLTKLIEEIKQRDEIILFIDEIHTLVGAGSSSRCALDAATILKPALARGELKCIGATTFNEYRKHFEKDSALERRFLPVKVPEPTVDETVLILKGLRERFEVHHKISYTDGALVAAAELSYQYISDRFLPDKAIDLIDEAGSRVHIEHYAQFPPVEASELDKESAHMTRDFEVLSVGEVKELDKEHGQITKEKNETACQQDFEKARDLHDLEMKMKPENSPPSEKGSAVPMVTEVDIRHIISMWTGIPVQDISSNELDRLLRMEETLHGRIVGQDDAVKAVSRAIRRARIGMKNPDRPIASFLFLGPTGVGKSELAKALAAYYFGSGEAMIRFDMSEFAERYTVSKLIGAPPGYVGYREGGGHLTEAVRRRPYAVILFDEVEKAHPDVRNVMLQILDEGRLTDNRGRLVDFKNTVVIMTSNIGSNVMIEKSDHCMGFDQTKGLILHELTRHCPPEFLNRLDEVIVFRQLGRSEVREIADMMLMEVFERLKAKEIEVRVSERFREKVVEEGYSPSHGARPLRRVVTRLLEDGLAVKILAGEIKAGDIVTVDVDSGGNTIFHI